MLEQYLIDYVDDLYNKQNINMQLEQQNLYTKQQYYDLLKPVIVAISKDYSIEEIRNILYKNSGIEDKVRNFIYKREIVPGFVFSFGTLNHKETIIIGNKQEVTMGDNNILVPAIEKMTEDTIFDLASITKLYTSLSILKLVELGVIKLDDKITRYSPQFKNLKDVTIFELLSFAKPLKTNGRVDGTASKEDSERILFDIEVDNNVTNRPYTDMGAMVLKYVIESASGVKYYDFVDQNILKPLKLIDTHVVVPKYKIDRVASTNFDGKLLKEGKFSLTTDVLKGVVYDPKARAMGQQEGILSGHAGLFSTAKDMTELAKGIINGQVIGDKLLQELSKNRTGKLNADNTYIQYLGYLCYSKHPQLENSELFHAMSGRSFASAGWTGTQLTVDPINNLFLFMAGNRSHNRMTSIDPSQRDRVITDENGKKTVVFSDGTVKIDATRFAWDRDEAVVHPALKLSIQYKMLEDVFKFIDEKFKEDENVRHIAA